METRLFCLIFTGNEGRGAKETPGNGETRRANPRRFLMTIFPFRFIFFFSFHSLVVMSGSTKHRAFKGHHSAGCMVAVRLERNKKDEEEENEEELWDLFFYSLFLCLKGWEMP